MSEKKMKKKQGPIRTGAVVPFILVTVLIVGFNILFLDTTIQKSLEFVGKKINGAQVDVGSVQTSFKELKIVIRKVAFTNKEIPMRNKFEIGEFRFQMLWDALLRGKIVINDAELKDILLDTERKKAGYVVPEKPQTEEEESKLAKEMLAKAKEEFKGNIFGDIASLISGEGSELGSEVEGNLKSKKRFAELEVEIAAKEKNLNTTLAKLPANAEIKDIESRINKIKWNDLSDLKKAPGVLKEADSLKKELDKTMSAYDKANKQVSADLKFMNDSVKEAEKLISEDLADIGKRLKLPSLDVGSIAQMLFGAEIVGKLGEVQKYKAMADKYLPPKKDKPTKPVPPPRGEGKNYEYGRPNSYPLFWLQIAKINSKNAQGELSGQMTNLTSNQRTINKATLMNLSGDFPPLEVRNLSASLMFDNREKAHATINGEIESFPVLERMFSQSEDVTFGMKKAVGRTQVKALMQAENLDFKLDNSFTQIDYVSSAKSSIVKDILDGVTTRTKMLTLNASVKGKWTKPRFEISSNLADAISSSVSRLVQAKIDAIKKKIKDDVEAQVASNKKKVQDQINGIKSQYDKQISQAKSQLNALTSKLDKQKKDAEKKSKPKLPAVKGLKL
jgi:uncharacterized protein (TIGR03545 family)